ncbi:PREDICTED: ubiquitin-like-specific protease 1 [Erythranthe guttata]|uniref:ubiquitin-like-specific protease 1 n=1 Tax=Erythranthe guttata TaxID=4155 RepID=UPI00064DC8E9|nr:PREDICTED: ubiquitin-like-specific protease 1 [Erythranthe guttata]XP_012841810.1 PREDICTED: ubiquitin-like-specific protease 1 [Erythranthe guttata]XP_012841811.1 PREDICTED: ubiquitin-like-specific protease 1 [Erythranthe guttata]XP_012841812.1 PREDICTED: ubiquitin-like-specific protease 1 [Erythranthe guttata]XP_012841813.1 PREDICTED: ubiquitin-like-specific protease 1 [Erythranthe guttata]XP_012841814.1 PREDICTED: ubiquitin-like-specific protease 1 [Erythranthe guttata]|eukprot:XP_012841809.1 PREDICTED: ubiquitin-like-specific protease 1 [Erythranthe guttata]
MSKQNEDRSTEGFKEDVINHSHDTRQREKVHDNFHTGTKLSLLSAQVTGHDKRITGSENQIAQLISIMDNFSNRLASVDQGGYQTVNQELGNKIVAMLQNLEATLPQLIRDALDEVMFKTNKQQKSLNVNIESPNMVESVFEMTKNNTIDLTSYDAEQPVAAKQEEAPISPEEHEDVIIDYLFNPNLDQRMSVIKFEAIGCNRNDLLCLKPETFLNGTVIDCVAHMLTQKAKENFAENKLFLPAQFAQLCLAGKTIINDDKIIPFLRYLTNEVEDDCQIYLPINDHKGHWFLGIVDLEMKHVLICDTLLSDATKDYRRNLLYEVITRMECLFEKLMPCKYRIKSIQDKFECDYPTWVPKQPNFYDCGVYVCMMMMFDRGIQQLSESQSVVVRERIAVAMYKWKNNKFAWPR